MARKTWKDAAITEWMVEMHSMAKEAAQAATDVLKEKSTD